MRLGVFGGSFNPPHVGHFLIASDAFEALGLDKLLIVPAAANPLKGAAPAALPSDRLRMAEMTFAGDPRFEVSSMEIERGGLSYTVDTLEQLASRHGSGKLFLLLGEDALEAFDQWREPERIREFATLAVMRRDGGSAAAVKPVPDGVIEVSTRRVDVSSTEIRARLRAGKSIKGFVPDSVERFIEARGLYR